MTTPSGILVTVIMQNVVIFKIQADNFHELNSILAFILLQSENIWSRGCDFLHVWLHLDPHLWEARYLGIQAQISVWKRIKMN